MSTRKKMQGRLAIHAVLFALIASLGHFAVLGSRLEVTTPGKRPEAAAAATTEGTADLVEDLPGWGKPTSRLFAGYITVSKEAQRALFYALVEASDVDPDQAPLVLWLNGGPGCSSLAGGFLSELGPYYPSPNGKLQANAHAWTRVANIIFLESPAFVGFSYSNTSSDRVVGDKRTAADTYLFLKGFLNRFPQYVGRPFWISGESYGGHYVPTLALHILQAGQDDGRLNLQGFLVGNAWTDPETDNRGALDFWFAHAMVSEFTVQGIYQACNFTDPIGPLGGPEPTGYDPVVCQELLDKTKAEMGNINIYEIYADVCIPKRVREPADRLQQLLSGARPARPSRDLKDGQYDPCVDSEVEVYFNRPEVQQALHANVTKLPFHWTQCAALEYSQKDLFSSMLPVYRKLLKTDISMLVYSGDVDGIVPVTGTRRWIRLLNQPISDSWKPWTSSSRQVGGYVVEHPQLTFATVRNAGHMVPYTQPERSFFMFSRWISSNRRGYIKPSWLRSLDLPAEA